MHDKTEKMGKGTNEEIDNIANTYKEIVKKQNELKSRKEAFNNQYGKHLDILESATGDGKY